MLSGADVEVSGPRHGRIATIATKQRGRVSRRQLLAAGITDNVIVGLVRRLVIFPLHPGVYAVGHLAPLALGDETAALLALPDDAALSQYSGAQLWGMLAPGARDGRIHIVVGHASSKRLPGVRIHRSRTLTPTDIRIRNGLPVTSPARTLLDLTEALTERELELAYDRALVASIVTADDVERVLRNADGRRGKRLLRDLLDRHRGPAVTRSQAEERFLDLIRRARLPEPIVNARVHGYEVDFLWPGRLIVEIDGFRFHSTRRAFEHDHRKDAVLRGAGLPVLRFTWHQLTAEPVAVVALVAQALTPRDS